MKILVVETGQRPRQEEIDGTVESIRKIVDGDLQAIYPENDVAVVYNKDGYSLQLPPNRGILDRNGGLTDIVRGTFLVCGAPEDGNYFCSLTEAQFQHYSRLFAIPEVFLNLGGRTIILPSNEECF